MTGWSVQGLATRQGEFQLGPVDLEVPEGSGVAVLGPSGAGKTTLLRTLTGLHPASEGRIRRGAEPVDEEPPERRRIGYVPQGLGLFPQRSVRENVAYPLEIRGERAAAATVSGLLERFGLGPLSDRRPSTLSTGQQQRVAVARALAARPELLLWDEPLSALDVVAREELVQALRQGQESSGLPLLVVTHDPSIAFSLADRFLVLQNGAPVFSGSAEGLWRAPPNVFAARFVGYENVFAPEDLRRAPAPGLASWLSERAGPQGLAFPAPPMGPAGGGGGDWTATVRRVEPGRGGWRAQVDAGGLSIWLTLDGRSPPRPGESVRFTVPSDRLLPLGSAARSGDP